VGQNK